VTKSSSLWDLSLSIRVYVHNSLCLYVSFLIRLGSHNFMTAETYEKKTYDYGDV
jgi:hypothetical protein